MRSIHDGSKDTAGDIGSLFYELARVVWPGTLRAHCPDGEERARAH
ncbi:hypothetical protein [Streptomyces sp. NPDC047071]